ncbi:MAG: hypothetical protein JSW02_02740 [candidate division WOR-3 bacterium]|nr:MAG: hypothetical protein JSW02_02740 [candidate division WOR-3 bacterium]
MKKYALLFIVILFVPLMAQYEEDEHTTVDRQVRTGLIIDKKDNQINFDEMWMNVVSPRIKNAQPVVIVDALEQPLTYQDLTAPCQVEMTYTYDESRKEYVPLKIKVLQQYEYDDKGFIITD